jgi:enamine deaminase RidA (YjgF/YER057c/UK114 family)
MNAILPEGWKRPIGYSNAIESKPGKLLFVAGQVGWNEKEVFESEEIAPQFEQALKNILTIVETAGGKPEHISRITAFCIDKPAYLKARPELGAIWRKLMGKHFPAMSMIFVADLLDTPGKIELEATAVIPQD